MDDHLPGVNGGSPATSYSNSADSGAINEMMKKYYDTITSKQQILLQGTDELTSYRIYGQDVSIVSSTASGRLDLSVGSNKVKINPAVKYDWDQEYYFGNVVASHKVGAYIAYALKARTSGVVRIINRKTAERALLKGFEGRVMDIAFAHIEQVLLACVDEIGALYIFKVEESNATILTQLLVRIVRPEGVAPTSNHRVIWCPYIPEENVSSDYEEQEPSDDVGKLLVLTHDNMAEMFNLDTVIGRRTPPGATLVSLDIPDGYQVLPGHDQLITDAVFSPDGSALGTASLDGEVRVFSVAINEDATPPKCLHKWKPHDGKPLSTLVFLDNYKLPQQQFWKFAITGANYNQEIKLWSCVSWTCLQTIRFFAPPDLSSPVVEPCLKAGIDSTAQYLVLSDIRRKAMYVFNIHQEWEDGRAHITTVSEFLLTSPCLSFTILEAGRKKFRKTLEGDNLGEYNTGIDNCIEDGRDEAEETVVCTFIRIYSVHTKALQELQIQYEPESLVANHPNSSISSMSQDELGFRDALTDISVDTAASDVEMSSVSSSYQQQTSSRLETKPYLLTPDAFTSSTRYDAVTRKLTESVDSLGSSLSVGSGSTFTQVTPVRDDQSETLASFLSSPGASSVALTQSRDVTLAQSRDRSLQTTLTPTSAGVPLPAATPGEDDLNASAKYSYGETSFSESPRAELFKNEPSAFSSPRQAAPMTPPVAPSASLDTGDLPTSDTLKALFTGAAIKAQGAATNSHSASSSRSGSLEVDTILNRSQDRGLRTSPLTAASAVPGEKASAPSPAVSGLTDAAKAANKGAPIGRKSPLEASPAPMAPTKGPYDSTIWPKAPDLATDSKRLLSDVMQNSDADLETEVVEICDDEPNTTGDVIEISDEDVQFTDAHKSSSSADSNNSRTYRKNEQHPSADPAIINQLSHLTSLLTSQQQELQAMRRDIHAQHQLIHHHQQHHQQLYHLAQQQQQSAGGASSGSAEHYLERIDAQLGDLQLSLSRQVDGTLTRFTEDQKLTIQEMAVERTNSERQRHDRLAANVAQQVTGRLDKAIKQEIKAAVIPGVSKMLDPIKETLHQELAQKLTATDQLLRDNINRLAQSKVVVDSIGQATAAAVQGQLQAVFRETFQNVIIPSFDKACQEMFHQINEAFSKGTKEYQSQLEAQTERLRKKLREQRDPVLTQLQLSLETQQKSLDTLQVTLARDVARSLDAQMREATVTLKDTLSQHVQQTVRQELNAAMKQQQDTIQTSVMHAMRSAAATPLPTPQASPDPQQIQAAVLHLLQQGQLNAAFQQALSASDLTLVMYVCDTVNPSQVFSQDPCPLQQPVLLSLIQQLSADLTQSTELKHRYLQEAIMNLDVNNSLTKEHMPSVIQAMCTKLVDYLKHNSTNKMARPMRMLLMASQSLQKVHSR